MSLPTDRIYLFDTSIWLRTKHPLIAATAAHKNMTVLHYDGHYDLLSEVLGFKNRWAAEPNSL